MICGMDYHQNVYRTLRSCPSISWQVPSMVPAYHSHSWDLSSLEQYFTLGLLTLRSSDYHAQDTPYQQLSTSQHSAYVLINYVQHFERHEAFHNWISLWQKVSGISLKYPPFFFEKDTSSDLWEVAMCLSKLLWMMVWFHSHLPFCTPSLKLRILTVGCGRRWCIKVSFLSLSSHSIWEWPVTFFSLPSRFDSMILSFIFGSLKGLGS